MEDNSELHPESLRIQCKKAIEVIDKENEAYEELISKLRTNIVENETMSGETADSIKAYASDLICVVEYAIKANEMDKADHQTLLNKVDTILADKVDVNEVLRGYDIHDEISYLENQISAYETKSQVEIQVLGLNAIMEDEYADQIEDLNKVLQDMHNKEERYDTIEAETKGLFSVTGEIKKIAEDAIEEMRNLFIDNKYVSNVNSIWKNELNIEIIKTQYFETYEYLVKNGLTNDQIVSIYNDNNMMFNNLNVTLKWSESDAKKIIQNLLYSEFESLVLLVENTYKIKINEAKEYVYKVFKNGDINILINAINANNQEEIRKVLNNVITEKIIYEYNYYDYSLNDLADIEYELSNPIQVVSSDGIYEKASRETIIYYLDPNNFINEDIKKYMFLDLTAYAGLTKEQIGLYLDGKGILDGMEEAYYEASTEYGINEAYLISHSLLETGNGTSQLAKGVNYVTPEGEEVMVYNMYGINATDSDSIGDGSEFAYNMGWFTPEEAILGGAEWIKQNFLGNKRTLYEMRWNPFNPGTMQYASDVKWAESQTYEMKSIMDEIPEAKLVFIIPEYSK